MSPVPSCQRALTDKRRAFTLIELLVVITIIAILATIVVPIFGRVQENSRESKCLSNLRQIGSSMSLYAGEHNSCLPAASLSKESQKSTSDVMWSQQLAPYLPLQDDTALNKENAVFVCPSAHYAGYTPATTSRTYFCSAALFYFASDDSDGVAQDPPELRRPSLFASASNTILVAEGKVVAGGKFGVCNGSVSWTTANADVKKTLTSQTVNLDFRHSDKMNTLYADGHAANVPFDKRATGITQPIWEGRTTTTTPPAN